MATTKVSALPAKTSLGGSEELLINDGGTSKKVTATNLLSGASVADGSISTAKIADDAVTEAKLANAINTAIAANTAKTTNATHSGEVTGATALTIADNVVDEANLKVSNSPTNGYFLSAQSGNTGGMTWAAVPANNTTSYGLFEMANTISSNYTITSGNNALTAGPTIVASGVSVTIPSGSTWVIA